MGDREAVRSWWWGGPVVRLSAGRRVVGVARLGLAGRVVRGCPAAVLLLCCRCAAAVLPLLCCCCAAAVLLLCCCCVRQFAMGPNDAIASIARTAAVLFSVVEIVNFHQVAPI